VHNLLLIVSLQLKLFQFSIPVQFIHCIPLFETTQISLEMLTDPKYR